MKRKFLMRLLAAFVVVMTAAGDACARAGQKTLSIVGMVTRVSDGDTIWVNNGLLRYKVRLNRIDAPESKQPYGKESAAHLKSLIFGKEVRVEYKTTDRYGRILGIVVIGEKDVNLQMVRDGYAWHYKHFDATPSYSAAESAAQSAKRGIWATTAPIPPHQWRKGRRKNFMPTLLRMQRRLFGTDLWACSKTRFWQKEPTL